MVHRGELIKQLSPHYEKVGPNPLHTLHQIHDRAFDWNLMNWNDVGQLYERFCLLKIASSFDDSFLLLGPNFLNHEVNTHVRSKGNEIAVPDIVVVDQGGILRALYEVKSGSDFHSQTKVKGFSRLLDYCRADSDYVFRKIMKSLAQMQFATLPQEYFVPPNAEIDVIFVSPGNNFIHPEDSQGFRISHRRIGLY